MQAALNIELRRLLDRRPSVGDLLTLCEENYRYLMRLAPQLRRLRGNCRSRRPDHQDLHLTVLEQTRYTTLVRLTYEFRSDLSGDVVADPDALLRVYHDARQVEVEDLKQQALPVERLYEAPGLQNKWRVHLFVAKWLDFCASQGHQFTADAAERADPVLDLG
jgi:uncharacterized protein YqiB (DUF1249 family)